jgi:bifunctional non-homologous end joining protein LigD
MLEVGAATLGRTAAMRAGRRDVRLTHPGKLLFPADGITKADLAAYYRDVAPLMLAHIRDRPVSLQRFNDGIEREGFFHKDVARSAPLWVRRVRVGKHGGSVCHALANDAATLVWMANQNAITPHVWTSRADRLERPDRMVFDLDPASEGDFGLVRRTARELGALLREAGVEPFAMTTGSKGVHVVVALRRVHEFDRVREAALAIAAELVARRPRELTTELRKAKREGRLFVDVNRNGWAATAVPPYAVRPRPGAPVATPLRWEELDDRRLAAQRFTLRTVLERGDDPWAGLQATAGRLPAV